MTAAGNAKVAFHKSKSSFPINQVGNNSKRVALELFPALSPALNNFTNDGGNQISHHNYETNVQSVTQEAQEDPFERLIKSQVFIYVCVCFSIFVLSVMLG